MNMQRYGQFCLADRVFFDTPERMPDEASRFASATRPAPSGWERTEHGWWVVLRPRGRALPPQGWKVHVSATLRDAEAVCDLVWRYCVTHEVAFKLLRSTKAVLHANAKHADRTSSGKLAAVYPSSDAELEQTLTGLAELLHGYTGPHVLSDVHFRGTPLYLRYGAFTAQTCPGEDGEPVPAVRRPDGRLVRDERLPVFTMPAWVSEPPILRPHLQALRTERAQGFPYQVERALHFSNGGGVYLARHLDTGQHVVLREARPNAGLDRDGVDAVTRLGRERAALERVAGLDCVPRVVDYRVAWEHHFLAEEYVEGTTVMEAVRTRYPLVHPDPSPQDIATYTRWAISVLTAIEQALRAVHSRGLRFGDLHPDNVIQRTDGRIVLVDFELATDLDDERVPALGAPGFTAPAGLSGADADWYLLNCLRLWMFLPLAPLAEREPAKLSTLADAITRQFPVPEGFGGRLVRELGSAGDCPDNDRAGALFHAASLDWPAIRGSLVAGIHASATPDRHDRLFPGDGAQFTSGGFTVAYGAAGVLYALHHAGTQVPDEYVDWLVRAARRAPAARPGLYDGLHGVAATLDTLGYRDEALDILERARAREESAITAHLMGGRAGIGLNLAHFGRVTGDSRLHAASVRVGEDLASLLRTDPGLRLPAQGGLLRGMSGPALLFLRLYADTSEPRYLDLAEAALRHDLAKGLTLEDGTFQLQEGSRYLAYLDGGSGGLALVLQEYLRHRESGELSAVLDSVRRTCTVQWVRQPGLFLGRAGVIAVLAQLDVVQDRPVIREHVRRLAWHAQSYDGHVAFPGAQMLRLSMDLATGSAGVLLALTAAFDGGVPVLPHLRPAADSGLTGEGR